MMGRPWKSPQASFIQCDKKWRSYWVNPNSGMMRFLSFGARVAGATSDQEMVSGLLDIDHGVAGIGGLRRHPGLHAAGPFDVGRDGMGTVVADRSGTEQDRRTL